MIVIPMLGQSARFFRAGYTQPKYQLPLAGASVFARVIKSFERYFESMHFLFIVRVDYDAKRFVATELCRLGLTDFRIVEMAAASRGQADTVMLGTRDYADDEELIIFNIDTIRHDFSMPLHADFADGFLEVFSADGDGWSFVAPGPNGRVVRTTEKVRISDLASNGLYGFRRLRDFRRAFATYDSAGQSVNGELYIAPLYNLLIADGMDIRYRVVDASQIDHCGVPADYERLRRTLDKTTD